MLKFQIHNSFKINFGVNNKKVWNIFYPKRYIIFPTPLIIKEIDFSVLTNDELNYNQIQYHNAFIIVLAVYFL